MRRSDREITDMSSIRSIIDSCKVVRLAIVGDGAPYIVPLNFGYAYNESRFTLYFHCADKGKKLDMIRKNPLVCFEMDTDHELTTAESACGYGYNYSSVIGTGLVRILENGEERKAGLKILMKHQTGREFDFTDGQIQNVTVCSIDVAELTAKQRKSL
jgi:uncharacterized protein